ncbi:Holliday junction branch migration protein RuvA [Lacticaseibacillus hulanensis]|jgi:Holliday junction DNA helicase RuvA|uniref:Holliday junction branch migration protein RuvA n=1 Tax=Lacticaseibacillus hulanensis TaxID=2493111 RepID=UPI000FDB5CF6|nr:Holliday junction branch migration protein RuvA [Lacticaseibacillus hulanensis]
MYEFFRGKVAAVAPDCVVIDVNGVGYRLLVANPYHFHVGEEAMVYAQLIIRENEQSLYGFNDEEQKRVFNLLLSVTGIGPKSALAILANVDTNGLAQAIASNDVAFLTRFPGVGKKTAAQIVLDLQGKIDKHVDLFTPEVADSAQPTSSKLSDALAALIALGFTEREVNKIEPKLLKMDLSDTDAYLRAGLKLLTKH